jgi:hypothetical protein
MGTRPLFYFSLKFRTTNSPKNFFAARLGYRSLTEPLRREILKGTQVYYIYDQHWMPVGQKVAAKTLYDYLKDHPKKTVASQ